MINEQWDRGSHRKVMLVGALFCAAFIAISFFARPQLEPNYVLKKADRLVRTVGTAPNVR